MITSKSAVDFISVYCLSKWGVEPELLKFSGRSPELTLTDLAELMDAYVLFLNFPRSCAFCGQEECDCPYPMKFSGDGEQPQDSARAE